MTTHQTIIDVTPIDHSSSQGNPRARDASSAHASSQSANYQQPSWHSSNSSNSSRNPNGYATPPFSTTYAYGTKGPEAASKTVGSTIGGFAQLAVGTGLVLIGIPMLILPGPGLLTIVGGAALAANGMRTIIS